MIQRNGFLWATHHVFLPFGNVSHTGVQWWQIRLAHGVPESFGRFDDSVNDTNHVVSYAYPSIAVNKFNDVLIGYSRFSTNQYASGNYAFHDTADAPDKLPSDTVLTNGLDKFQETDGKIRVRWGDFSSTVVDPVNDTDLWTLQEYARLSNVVTRWGTQWGQIAPVVFSNDTFASATSISGSQGTNTASLERATMETGEPNHAGNPVSPSLWYRWTAPVSAYVRFTVSNALECCSEPGGSDTTIALYTGSAVNSLTLVTNRHGLDGSNVVFNATANTTYRVAVAGYGGRRGAFTLSWRQTNAPMVTADPQDWDVYEGTNITFSVTVSPDTVGNYWFRRHGNSDLNSITNLIANVSSNSFTLSNVTTNQTGYYSILASNSLGTAISRTAHLQVYSTQAATLSDWSYAPTQWRQVVSAITGSVYVVQASTDLVNWLDLETNTVTFTNFDKTITNFAYRFYRVRTQ